MPTKIPAVEIAVRTDPGRDPDKQVNEDGSVYKETPLGLLAVVCDGMGGHAGGKEASELAIATIVEIIEAAPAATPAPVALKHAIEEANARIWTMPTAEAGFRPGSTVVALLAHENGAEIAHVGDSRIYHLHAGAIAQVTRDHSMVQEMVDRNLIRAEDAAKHPDANKILRALGIAKDVDVELRFEPIAFVTGDIFVLCSDGLSDLVEPAEILRIAGSHPPAQAAGQLVDLANARGGHDNITAMVLRMKTSAAVREGATLLKTMPLTQTDTAPGGGPTGTLLSPVLAPSPQAHVQPPPPPPPHVPPPHDSSPRLHPPPVPVVVAAPPPVGTTAASRIPLLGLGILLAIVAVGIVGAVVFVALRPEHRAVPVVDDRRQDAGASAPTPPPDDDDDGGSEPQVAPAPTLGGAPSGTLPVPSAAPTPTPPPLPPPTPTPPGTSRNPNDASVCVAARQARAAKKPDSQVKALENQCRARGGTP